VTDDAPFEESGPRSPACLGAIEPDQQFCLLCGERLKEPGPPRSSPLLRRGKKGLPLVLFGTVLVLFGGLGIAWGFTREETKKVATTTAKTTSISSTTVPVSTGVSIPQTQSLPETSPSPPTFTNPPPETFPTGTDPTPTDTDPTPTDTDPTPTDTDPTPTDTDPAPEEGNDWPEGTDGFAVLLASKDTEQFDFAFITQQKDAAEAKGYDNAGVLNSDDYFTLNPGYWVLYLGPYSTKAAADAAKAEARADGYPDAYVRRVAE
jgi:SPOR domain